MFGVIELAWVYCCIDDNKIEIKTRSAPFCTTTNCGLKKRNKNVLYGNRSVWVSGSTRDGRVWHQLELQNIGLYRNGGLIVLKKKKKKKKSSKLKEPKKRLPNSLKIMVWKWKWVYNRKVNFLDMLLKLNNDLCKPYRKCGEHHMYEQRF